MNGETTEAPAPKETRIIPVGMGPRGIVLTSLDEVYRFAKYVHASPFKPQGFQSPEAIVIAIEYGLEVGLSPLAALQNIAVINGKPAIYGDAMLALVQQSGLLDDFDEHADGQPYEDAYRWVCVSKRRGRSRAVVRWFSVSDAKRAKLWGKEGPWTFYPERMLMFRARSFNLRDNFGDVLRGLRSAEELLDTEPQQEGESTNGQTLAIGVELPPPPAANIPPVETVSTPQGRAEMVKRALRQQRRAPRRQWTQALQAVSEAGATLEETSTPAADPWHALSLRAEKAGMLGGQWEQLRAMPLAEAEQIVTMEEAEALASRASGLGDPIADEGSLGAGRQL